MEDAVLYILAGLLAVVVFRSIRKSWNHSSRLPYPPGPKALPIIGNLYDVPTDPKWLGYSHLAEKYGDLLYIQVFGQPMIILGSQEAAVDLLERRSSIYSDRLLSTMITLMGWEWNLAQIPYGQSWRDHRRGFHQYFNNAATEAYSGLLEQQQLKFLEALLHRPKDFAGLIRFSFGASIFNVVYGIDVKDESDTYLRVAEDSLESLAEALILGKYWVDFLPFLKSIPAWFPGAEFQRVVQRFKPSVLAVKEAPYEAAHGAWISGVQTGSVVEKMLNKLDQSSNPKQDMEIAKDVAGIGFVGGADTSMSTALSFFFAMAMHPEVQRKAHAELDTIVGSHRLPCVADRSSLPYIEAILRESLRWQPVLPLGVAHRATTDDEYRGYFIPKGALVVPNQWAILHDPQTYPDPERFMPDRFIKDGKLNPHIRNPNTAAFGFGRRICPGRYFAEMALFLTMASVLQVFDISPPLDEDGRPVQLKVKMTNGGLSYPEAFECVIKPRSDARAALINEAKTMM